MSKIIFLGLGLLMSAALHATPAETQNCVNPGGGCDGTVPCCNSSVNACVQTLLKLPRRNSMLAESGVASKSPSTTAWTSRSPMCSSNVRATRTASALARTRTETANWACGERPQAVPAEC